MFSTYLDWLREHQFHGIKPGLTRIIKLLQKLGYPHLKYPTLHIAGTNGKGSTCAILSTLLSTFGFKTGLYTSPHLFKLNERFKINNLEIRDDELAYYLKILKNLVEEPITYFELTTALAFLYFAEERVDIAVIETGLGGRLDATNVIKPEISFITSIGLDHLKYLGESLEKIAYEKSGIIKRQRPVIVGAVSEAPLRVILDRAKKLYAPTYVLNRDFKIELSPNNLWNYTGKSTFKDLDLSLKGLYQGFNLALALKGFEILEDLAFLKIEEPLLRRALKEVKWEGRYKKISFLDKEILIDCAHNLEGISLLKESLLHENFYPFTLILGITNEDGKKPYLCFLEKLSSLSERIFLCEFVSERKIVTLSEWKKALKKHPSLEKVEFFPYPELALKKALKSTSSKILITGSLYFISNILKYLNKGDNGISCPNP